MQRIVLRHDGHAPQRYRQQMVMSKRWGVFFTSRILLIATTLAKAKKTLGSVFGHKSSRSENPPLWTKPEQLKVGGTMKQPGPDPPKPDVPHLESEADRPQALGASALLSAWKERDAVLASQPQSSKVDVRLTHSEPDQKRTIGAAALLDAWKERAVASSPLPKSSKLDIWPPRFTPDQQEANIASGKPVPPVPGRLAMVSSVFLFGAAAAVVGAWAFLSTDSSSLFDEARTNVDQPNPSGLAPGQLVACPAQLIAAVAGEKDGRFPMQADESGLIVADIASFLILGQAALAAGRVRDAEVALLMSCRIAEKLKGLRFNRVRRGEVSTWTALCRASPSRKFDWLG